MLTTCVCADAADSAANAGVQPSYNGKSEYYTQDEMSAMFKPKKKKVSAPPPSPLLQSGQELLIKCANPKP